MLTRDGKAFLTQLKAEFSDLDLRLSIMDQQGVDMQVLSPAGSYFFYWMAAGESLGICPLAQRPLAEAVAKHPRRLVALASVPMQDSARAAAELERAMTKLGLRGAEIASNINGRYFDDPAFDPFWEAAQALDARAFCPSESGGRRRAHEGLQSGQSDRQSDRHLVGLCQVDLRRCLGALSPPQVFAGPRRRVFALYLGPA